MKTIEPPPVSEDYTQSIPGFMAILLQQNDFFDEKDTLLALIEKCNQEYYYWDKVKYQKMPTKLTPENFWHFLKDTRRLGAKKITFGKEHFEFFVTPYLQELLHKFDLELGGQFGGRGLSEQDKSQYLISSIMEEAIASSQIEGAVTTRKVAKEMLQKNLAPRDTSQQMIVNNYQTIKYLSSIKSEKMTPLLLCEIQSRITHQTLNNPNYSGVFRTSDDIHIVDVLKGETVYIPPQAQDLAPLIASLCLFLNDEDTENGFIHPLVRACILHFMLGYIHPFFDGNGRTARAIFYWYALKRGYWLVEFLSISRIIAHTKNRYYKAFQYSEIDGNDLTYFVQYQLNTLHEALKGLQTYIAKKVKEKTKALTFQKIAGINQRQALILGELHRNPDWAFSVKEIEVSYAVSNQTARTDIAGLCQLGYVEVIKINAKEQKYIKGSRFDDLLKKV